jgi:hypothetical protein
MIGRHERTRASDWRRPNATLVITPEEGHSSVPTLRS